MGSIMLKARRKRFGRLRHLSTEKSLKGITVLLVLKRRRLGQMDQSGLLKSSLIIEKGNKH